MMKYQEYLKKTNELIEKVSRLYDKASLKLSEGDKEGAKHIYAKIDEVQKELDNLKNPEDKIATEEELTLKFDS
jgi:hypothetical protein